MGAEADEMHRKIGMLIATIGVNALFLQGDFSEITAAGASGRRPVAGKHFLFV